MTFDGKPPDGVFGIHNHPALLVCARQSIDDASSDAIAAREESWLPLQEEYATLAASCPSTYAHLYSRVTGELTALVGARVMGEHRHPAPVEQFIVLEGA